MGGHTAHIILAFADWTKVGGHTLHLNPHMRSHSAPVVAIAVLCWSYGSDCPIEEQFCNTGTGS